MRGENRALLCTNPQHIVILFIITMMTYGLPAEAGLLSALSKAAKKIDSPDVDLSTPFRFGDDLSGFPEGSVAEIQFVDNGCNSEE